MGRGFYLCGPVEGGSLFLNPKVNRQVKKGDQLGMFHFGGSTHCLIFQPHVNLEFDLRGQAPSIHAVNIPVRARIATVAG